MLSSVAVALIVGAAVMAAPVSAQPREVLKFDLTSAEPAFEADTGDGFVVRADNHSEGGWGWVLGVYRRGSDDNLLYPKGNWHGAFPCQIFPNPDLRKIFPDERVIEVRSTRKVVTLQLSGLEYDTTKPPWRFTAGTARVLWGATSNNRLEPTASPRAPSAAPRAGSTGRR